MKRSGNLLEVIGLFVKKESLVDIAIERIKKHISNNGFRPGDKYLSEKELTENLQVSRTVVREALIALQSIGLLSIRRGGVYIDNQDFTAIKEILQHHYDIHGVKLKELVEIRQIIELGALRLMTKKNIHIDFELLRNLNQAYYEAIIAGKDTRGTDKQFHRQLIKATDNDTFYNFSEIINDYFSITNMDLIQTQATLLQSYESHEALIDAIEARDLEAAERIMMLHLQPIQTYINHLEAGEKSETDFTD